MFFIYLIILSLPLYLVRFSAFGFSTNILDFVIALFLVFLLADYLYIKKLSLRSLILSIYFKNKDFLWPIIAIFIGLMTSITKSINIFASLGIIKSWFVLPILFFVGLGFIADSEKKKNNILKIWFLGSALVAVMSLCYYFTGFLTYDGRLSAFFFSPNNLAMFLAPSFIIGLWFILFKEIKLTNFYLIAGLFMVGFAIFATKSLGGFIAIFISSILLVSNSYKEKENKNIFIFFLIVLLFFATTYLFYIHDFGERSSLVSRIMIWKSAIKILSDNYVLGIGPGMFQENYLSYQKYFTPYLEWAVPHPHNILLAFWLQSGIVGLVGFLWLIILFFKKVVNNKNNKIVLLSGALMVYFLVHGLVDVTYWRNDLAVMFWMAIFLAIENKLYK